MISEKEEGKKYMVKHIVMWKLKEQAAGGSKQQNGRHIKEKLEALVGIVPGLVKAEVGFNMNGGHFDLCLYSEFSDRKSLEIYQTHPAHLLVKQFVHEVIDERVASDYMV